MNVHQLKSLRLAALSLIFAAPVAVFLLPSNYLPLVLAAMLLLLLVSRRLLRLMFVRLSHLANDRLDPDALRQESEIVFRILRRPAIRKNMNFVHIYQALLHDLLGEFEAAAEDTMQIAFGMAKLDTAVQWDLVYYYLRAGKLPMAEALMRRLMREPPARDSAVRSSWLHTMGLHHLERGDVRQAGESLEEALKLARRNRTRLNCLYDLARLKEKQGNSAGAAGLYRQAAELGPKAWLGQEAARRLKQG